MRFRQRLYHVKVQHDDRKRHSGPFEHHRPPRPLVQAFIYTDASILCRVRSRIRGQPGRPAAHQNISSRACHAACARCGAHDRCTRRMRLPYRAACPVPVGPGSSSVMFYLFLCLSARTRQASDRRQRSTPSSPPLACTCAQEPTWQIVPRWARRSIFLCLCQ